MAAADWGQAFTAIQDAKTLTITRRALAGNEMTELFKLDGSESTNVRSMGQRTTGSVSTAVWRGTKLVITTRDVPITRTLSLGSDGLLTIETLRKDRAGQEDRGGVSPGEWVVTKRRYRKG